MTPQLSDDLKRDEGCRTTAYEDTVGVWTIGYGHAHVAPGTVWTLAQCSDALTTDIARAVALCTVHIPWWLALNDARQDVMVNLMFNMGWGDGVHGLSSFKNTLRAIEDGRYVAAAAGLLASRWAKQVKGRAIRLAAQMRTGVRAPTAKEHA